MTSENSSLATPDPSSLREPWLAADRPSKKARIIGALLSGFGVLFLSFDASLKLLGSPEATETTGALGFPTELLPTLGVLQVILLALYLIPRTSVLGAVLWVGYLGGAMAIHVRIHNPLASHVLFPVYVAAFLWGGLALRDPRVRALTRDLFGVRRGRGSSGAS